MSPFDLYFASVVSMQFHPGAGTRGHVPLTPVQCAEIAMDMVRIRNEVLNADNRSIGGRSDRADSKLA